MSDIQDRLQSALRASYRIERELGQGGMATVFLAHDLKHDRDVAIKVMRPEIAQTLGADRFVREIGLMARLNHPHILALLDSGATPDDGGGPILYYVMPFIRGESLRSTLQREGRLAPRRAVAIAQQVAGALEYAHRLGIIHRDIKPENILLHEGEATVSDFGIAVAISAAQDARLTATGVSLGSPAYMSPEQILGERELDARADVYSLACLLYESIAGEPPLSAPTLQAIASRRITEPAPRISSVVPSVAPELDEAIRRALEPDRDARTPTAAAFGDALGSGLEPQPAGSDLRTLARLAKRPVVFVPAAVVLAALLAIIVLPARARSAREEARGSLPRIATLAAAGRYPEAFALAERAERTIKNDTTLRGLMWLVSDRITITSNPTGARVSLQRFAPSPTGEFPPAAEIGTTPVSPVRVARGDYRVVFRKDGFAPVERLASTAQQRAELFVGPPNEITIAATLHSTAESPAGMVFVPGGEYTITNPDFPTGLTARLDDYWIDRTEVTNEQYKAFMRAGGYDSASHWSDALTVPGRAAFADRTGMPGPRHWVGQDFASGTAAHPVTGVSWYEGAAYCASVGKALPTMYQWDKAARNGISTPIEGMMMPWGYTQLHDTSSFRANFGSTGTAPADAYPFGISAYGAYGMAGNVKEWLRNPMGEGFGVTGGSWEDPMYLYTEVGGLPPDKSSGALGFRCARVAGKSSGDQGAGRVAIEQRTPTYTPVDRRTFEALLTHYRYDKRPLAPRVRETRETDDWTRLKVWYNGVGADSVLAYLYLPKHASPPFQTMVMLPSSGLYYGQLASAEAEWLFGPSIKAGRALMIIVLKGMTEREYGPGYVRPAPSSVRYRDRMVLHATEMRLGLDYLETRPDIDATKLAYVGLSLSAGSALPLAGVDDRFRSVILIGAGIDERLQPTLPEASNINFAPYIRAPKLMLNGRNDEEHPYFTRALPLWNLLRPPKKLVLVDGAGHTPPLEARIPAVNAWLDSTLGPVRR